MPLLIQHKRFLISITISLLALGSTIRLSAQTSDDLASIIISSNIGDADVAIIRSYAQTHLQGLRQDDAASRTTAREALREPIIDITLPSVSFRLAYDAELRPALEQLISGGDIAKSINAIYIIGDVGTGQSLDFLIASLGNEDASIRYATAVALRRSLQIIDADSGAVGEQRVPQIINSIELAIGNERNVLVVDALIRALEVLQTKENFRNQANLAVCRGVVQHFRNPAAARSPLNDILTLIRALVVVRDSHFDVRVGVITTNLDIQTGDLSGQAMSYIAQILPSISPDNSQLSNAAAAGLKAAETLASLANGSLRGPGIPTQNILDRVDDWQQGGAAPPVIAAVREWIASGGRLTRRPFNLDASNFEN